MGMHLRFHMNSTRTEQHGNNVLKNLYSLFDYTGDHELVDHTWLPHAQFLDLIRYEIDLGMQVSFTETYNIVAADHIACGTPIVTSPEITFVLPIFHANPNNIPQMTRCLHRAYWLKKFNVHELNRVLLKWSNQNAVDAWAKGLDKISKPNVEWLPVDKK